MYILKDGKKIRYKEKPQPTTKETFKLPSEVIRENFDESSSKCSNWIYIAIAIVIFLIAVFLIYWIMTKNKTITRSSSKQRFGFRFY